MGRTRWWALGMFAWWQRWIDVGLGRLGQLCDQTTLASSRLAQWPRCFEGPNAPLIKNGCAYHYSPNL